MNLLSLLQILLGILLSAGSVFGLLRLGLYNEKKGLRHRQWIWPPISILFSLGAIYTFFSWERLMGVPVLANILQALRAFSAELNAEGIGDLFFCLGITLIYAMIRLAMNALDEFRIRKKIPQPSKFSIAYTLDEAKQPVLKRSYAFAHFFFRYLSLTLGVLFALLTIYTIARAYVKFRYGYEWPYIPMYSPFALLIVLESYWYLSQDTAKDKVAAPVLAPEDDSIAEDYERLWEEYQKVFPEHLLLAWRFQDNTPPAPPPTASINYTPEVALAMQALKDSGHLVSRQDADILLHLLRRNDLLVDDVIVDKSAPILFYILLRRLMDGEHVLVLTPERCHVNSDYHETLVKWVEQELYETAGNRDFWKAQKFTKAGDIPLTRSLVVSSADDLLEKQVLDNPWFKQLRTVVYVQAEALLSTSLSANSVLIQLLRERNDQIQNIVLSRSRHMIDDAVERNLHIKTNMRETRMDHERPKASYLLFWKSENGLPFQNKLLTGDIQKDLGAEAVLSLLARRDQIQNIALVEQNDLPYQDQLSNTDNNKKSLRPSPVPAHSLKYTAEHELSCDELSFLLPQEQNSFIIARDTNFNAISTLRNWYHYGQEHVFVQVVSPPYLLRDYLIAHADYFLRTPLLPFTGRLVKNRFELARRLLEMLVAGECSEQAVSQEMEAVLPDTRFISKSLQSLFWDAFNIDIIANDLLQTQLKRQFNRKTGKFEELVTYSLLSRIKEDLNLNFLQDVHILDNSQNILSVISYDLLFQNYLPNQVVAFGGKSYQIKGFDARNNKLRTNQHDPRRQLIYRPDREVVLKRLDAPKSNESQVELRDRFSMQLGEGQFEVRTKGYCSFNNGISLHPNEHTYTVVRQDEVPVRNYPLGRVLTMSIDLRRLNGANEIDVPRTTASLCLLLQEMMPSLFPETHQYVLITSHLNELADLGEYEKLFPQMRVAGKRVELAEPFIELCLFEDAHQDVGVLQNIYDRWEDLLSLVDDVLTWMISEAKAQAHDSTKGNYGDDVYRKVEQEDKKRFLQYGLGELPPFVDLAAVSKVLRHLLGNNNTTTNRNNFYR